MSRLPIRLPERNTNDPANASDGGIRRAPLTLVVLLAIAAVTLLTSGCDNHVLPNAPDNPKIFNTMLGKDPVSLDPMMAQDQETQAMVKELFDGLVDYDPKTRAVIPAVAERWEAKEEGKVWIFHLRKDVKFHDATELTAEDFKFGWSRVASRNSASPLFYLMAPIKGYDEVRARKAEEVEGVQELEGIEVVDDHTLRVELEYPFADFPKMLGHVAFSPVHKRTLDLSIQDFHERPAGNGPFEVADWRHGVEVIFDRFDAFYGKAPKLDRVQYTIYDDEDAAWEDFTQGALDETQIPAGRFAEIASDPEFKGKVHSEATLGLVYLGFNAGMSPYGGNTALRRAFNHAIDRDSLLSRVDAPASPAVGMLPSAIPGATEKTWPYLFNRQAAASELSAARTPGGRGLTAVSVGFNRESGHQPMMDSIASSLRASGIDVILQTDSFSRFREKLELGQLPIFLTGWIADYPAPDAVLAPLFLEVGTGDALSAMNLTRLRSPELTRDLMAARSTMDDAARDILYQKLEETLAARAPIVPLYELRTRRAVQPWVLGYVRTAFDDTPYEQVDLDRESIKPAPAGDHEAAPAEEHGAETPASEHESAPAAEHAAEPAAPHAEPPAAAPGAGEATHESAPAEGASH